jgi:hypothetical protein
MSSNTHEVHVYQCAIINRKREEIWNIIGNFFDASWSGGINRTEKKTGDNVKVDTRFIFATDTRYVTEELLETAVTNGDSYYKYNLLIHDGDKSTFAFHFQPYDYTSELKVLDITIPGDEDKSVVVWRADCKAESEEAREHLQQAVTRLFTAGLTNLKKRFD